jgi:hypothetical protein
MPTRIPWTDLVRGVGVGQAIIVAQSLPFDTCHRLPYTIPSCVLL